MNSKTISDQYLKLQTELHKNPNYGMASLSFAPIVADLIRLSEAKTVSDYGAGKQRLLEGLEKEGVNNISYFPYDPVFPNYGPPRQAELVCCIDVLEHIEPEKLEGVLNDLATITVKLGFFSIHMGPAEKILADGRNAHLIQQPSSWWLKRICEYFNVLQLESHGQMGRGFWVIVEKI
jgi:hypothetical protein